MLTIGIDFDNTIVSYDMAFYRLAVEKKWIDTQFAKNKLMIRNHLKAIGKENEWTVMQGEIYGSRMDEAVFYPGVTEFIATMQNKGNQLHIISHKTKRPFEGRQYDLHYAALNWIKNNLRFQYKNVYFELTKKEKIERIIKNQCNVFIDDLPEIFNDPLFPTAVKKILFDPQGHYKKDMNDSITVCGSWNEVLSCLL